MDSEPYSTGMLGHRRLQFSDFEFDVLHRAGMKHEAANALSRLVTMETDQMSIEDKMTVLCITASISQE